MSMIKIIILILLLSDIISSLKISFSQIAKIVF